MLCDYRYKQTRYRDWQAGLETCSSRGPSLASLSTLGTECDYAPLLLSAARAASLSVPATPLPARRRLLRRSETVGVDDLRSRHSRSRKLSLPPKISKSKLYMSVDTIEDAARKFRRESSDKISEIRAVGRKQRKVPRRQRRRSAVLGSSGPGSECSLGQVGSDHTLGPAVSGSEFSTISGPELEYDLYDCHIGNAMQAPGSLFAPAYWDDGAESPELELEELGRLFPGSPVQSRLGRRDTALITSITSDLTASITSAMSDTTLVGERQDGSCYHSSEEEPLKQNILNLTHIEEIQFADE